MQAMQATPAAVMPRASSKEDPSYLKQATPRLPKHAAGQDIGKGAYVQAARVWHTLEGRDSVRGAVALHGRAVMHMRAISAADCMYLFFIEDIWRKERQNKAE